MVVISKGKASGRVSDAHIAPWDLDRLFPELLEAAYRELERFVTVNPPQPSVPTSPGCSPRASS